MEELDFQGLLDHFKNHGFQRGEQVILGHFGTVQTLLSLIFGKPANIKLVDQRRLTGVISRQVELRAGDTLVGYANTRIPKDLNRDDVFTDIVAGRLGLGQIVVTREIPNKRNLLEVGRDKHAFWRRYTIEGPQLFLEISEYFPREPFEAVGWLEREEENGT